MHGPLTPAHHDLIRWLAEMVVEDMEKLPTSGMATSIPPPSGTSLSGKSKHDLAPSADGHTKIQAE